MLPETPANCGDTTKEPIVKTATMLAGLTATTLVVGVAVTGCGNNKSSTPSSSAKSATSSSSAASSSAPTSSSGAAQPTDYSNLLIKPADIVVPGDTFNLMQTVPIPNPAGISGLFMNQGNSRTIDDTIYVYSDPGAAAQARDAAVKSLSDPDLGVRGATPTPVDVGSGGTMAIGTTVKSEGPKAKASMMFTEGKTFVDLEFESPSGDPVPQDFVVDVARKQDAAIKAGLPG
jgi:hypothetical protein